MKKGVVIFIIAVIAVVLIYGIFKITTTGTLFCAKAGLTSSNPSLGPLYDPDNKCCSGLKSISADLRYAPDNEDADENGCIYAVGAGSICSDCGNRNCEPWENPCNCPDDCKK